MPEFLCPRCNRLGEAAAIVRTLAICIWCGESVRLDPDPRIARFSDLEDLSPAELLMLRRARGAIARSERRP